MIRTINAAFAAMVLATAVWTYNTKHQTELQLAEIRTLKAQITTERETIELLKADLAFLGQPARLQALAEKFHEVLGLGATASTQIVRSAELPTEPIRDASDGIADILAGEAADSLTTGSIGEDN